MKYKTANWHHRNSHSIRSASATFNIVANEVYKVLLYPPKACRNTLKKYMLATDYNICHQEHTEKMCIIVRPWNASF